jgi:hypothetical protein
VFGCWDIVNGTEEQPKDKFDKDGNLENVDEIEGFKDRYQYTSAFYLETIDPTWLTVLTTYRTPSAIWKALQDKFARENTTSFYNHLSGLLNLRMESKSKATEHLTPVRQQLEPSAASVLDGQGKRHLQITTRIQICIRVS